MNAGCSILALLQCIEVIVKDTVQISQTSQKRPKWNTLYI